MIDGVVQFDLPTSEPNASLGGPLPSFIAGPENSLVVPPLERLLGDCDLVEAARLFNPLVLVGTTGSGKSQLAQAIVRRWSRKLQDAAVAYFTAADFGREMQAAAVETRLPAWRSAMRSLRLLVIEDLDRLRLNPAIQQELRATLDAVAESGGLVVVTSKREPIGLPQLDAGLCDRLAGGLTVRLQRPAAAAREAIIRLAAAAKRLALTDDQISHLAHREAATPAELVGRISSAAGGCFHLSARAGAADAPAPGSIGSSPTPTPQGYREPTLKQIIAVAARYFGVTQAALTGPSRRCSLVQARNIVVHLARRLTELSYADIGRGLGGRDHTTAMHADRRVIEQLARDPLAQQAVDELDRLLR